MPRHAEIGRMQTTLVELQSAVSVAAISPADYARALLQCEQRGLTTLPQRGLQNLIGNAIRSIIITSTRFPPERDISRALASITFFKKVIRDIRLCLPPREREKSVIEEDSMRIRLAKIPPLEDPAVVGVETFKKVLAERASALGTGALFGFAGLATIAVIVLVFILVIFLLGKLS